MNQILKDKIIRAFKLTTDLFSNLEEINLKLKLANLPSNTIGGQAWCIIGARESYLEAIKTGEWRGWMA